ncbi:hypothetical protein FA15DRAFT_692376 [Coprinopsis marcescibilis]|uniref:Amino acid transporter transmembrane domain-containing protein n=1 Tax=Coprinopsis marcescibilis TaxID=230819 RepID=A0A5C3L4P4_COPMA|nr:hypothetical protein FA15DRAFT_692376 [Coprinopsis marcescibilis]
MVASSHVAAVVASNRGRGGAYSRPTKPTPLILPDEHENNSQRQPANSVNFDDDESEIDSPQSPGLSGLDSSAALILVHDEEEREDDDYGFTDDEDGDVDDIVSPVFEIRRTSIPPLPPLSIFLYLLAPYLKLGALNTLTSAEGLPLKYGLPALFGFALLSAFSRQSWYMLARYLRKADVMEVVCDTYAKARGKERQRAILRTTVKLGTALVSGLLAIVYLHESANHIFPLLDSLASRIVIGTIFSALVVYLSSAQSLASKRVILASWLSVLSYVAWLSCAIYAHAKGILPREGGWFSNPPSFWQGIFTIAFAFTTTSTLPIYASLKSGVNPVSTAKTPRSRSFRILSLTSVFCAILLILPLVIFAAKPNIPASGTTPTLPDNPISLPVLPDATPEIVRVALAILSSTTLLLGVPQAALTVPPIPLRVGRTAAVSRTATSLSIVCLAVILSFIRSSFIEHLFTPLNILLIIITLTGTYFLPALLHISVHFFKRPMAIVIPRTPLLQTPSTSTAQPNLMGGERGVHDELLQRKERALQKKQFRKRILWDVGAWIQVFVYAAGVVAGFSLLLH